MINHNVRKRPRSTYISMYIYLKIYLIMCDDDDEIPNSIFIKIKSYDVRIILSQTNKFATIEFKFKQFIYLCVFCGIIWHDDCFFSFLFSFENNFYIYNIHMYNQTHFVLSMYITISLKDCKIVTCVDKILYL